MNNKLVVADLGAAGNLIKNLVLLSDDIHWPLTDDRYQTILNQYISLNNFSEWLTVEYRLRFWKKEYGIDLSDNLDFEQYKNINKCSLPIVFLNHSAFFQLTEFNKFIPCIDIVYIAPVSKFGVDWQVRSYCEKKTVPLLHDFSYETNRIEQITHYKNTNGTESYYRMNIANMKDILAIRQKMFKAHVSDNCFIPLEELIQGPIDNIINVLSTSFNITLPVHQVIEVVDAWRHLHWPPEKTSEWKYHDCIA
jgi:hypothetical protein